MVEVKNDVVEARRVDRVRVLIKTMWRPAIQHMVNAHIGGEIYRIHIVEENGPSTGTCNCRFRSAFRSSEEIDSDESDIGTPISKVDRTSEN